MGRVKGRPGLYREGAAPPELPRFLFNRFPGLYRGGRCPPNPPVCFGAFLTFSGAYESLILDAYLTVQL